MKHFFKLTLWMIIPLLLLCETIEGQEMTIPTKRAVKIVSNDTTVIAEVRTTKQENLKIDRDKWYYWFDKEKINWNRGGYHNKLLHGTYELFVNGKLREAGEFNDGLKNGIWKKWSEAGNYYEILEWKKGFLHGSYTNFHPSGKKKENYLYKRNKKNGAYKIWNEKEELIERGNYQKGLKHGTITSYEEDGQYKKSKYRFGEPTPQNLNKDNNPWLRKIFPKKKEKEGHISDKKDEHVDESDDKNKMPFFKRLFRKKEKEDRWEQNNN